MSTLSRWLLLALVLSLTSSVACDPDGDGDRDGDGDGDGDGYLPGNSVPGLGDSVKIFLSPYANCSLVLSGQNATYDRCVELNGGFELYWNLPSNSTSSHYVQFAFRGQSDNEWISVGKSRKGLMIRSSAIVGYNDNSNGLKVLQYYLAGKKVDTVAPGGNLTLKDEKGDYSAGYLTLQFSLLLNETELNSSIIIWAKGTYDSNSEGSLSRHQAAYSGLLGIFQEPIPRPSASNSACTFTFGGSTESYSNCQSLNGGFWILWNYATSGTKAKISIAFNYTTTGYIGLGFGSRMIGSSAIIGRSSSSGVVVKQYALKAYSPSSVVPGGSLTVSDLQGESTSSALSVKFVIELPESQTSDVSIIWAQGTYDSNNGDTLNTHSKAFSGSVNFLQGTVVGKTVGAGSLKNSHGVLNAVGWGIVIPIGIIIARYFRASDPLWFFLHLVFQLVGVGLGLAGFITGIRIKNRTHQTKNPHYSFAIVILILSFFQVTALVLRPKKGENITRRIWNIFHHWSGRTALILGIVNVYIGFHLLDPARKYRIGYTIVLAALGGVALALEVAMFFGFIKREAEKESKPEEKFGAELVNQNE